jgi:hypothetical protein
MNIPLLIPCYNQLTYLRNLINWFRFYSNSDIYILDNASSYLPLVQYLSCIHGQDNIHVVKFQSNQGSANLKILISERIAKSYEYYIISDPDIMPHPSVPQDFLDIFRHCIDNLGYHHVGFCLKIDDLPDFIENKASIIKNEAHFWQDSVIITYDGRNYKAYKAPIDTTFALYRSDMGWTKPMPPEWWNNSLRIFEAFHLPWYLDPKAINDEMDYYFKIAKGPISIQGKMHELFTNYRPVKYVRQHLTDEIANALDNTDFVNELNKYLGQKDQKLLKTFSKIKESKSVRHLMDNAASELTSEILFFMRLYIYRQSAQEKTKS